MDNNEHNEMLDMRLSGLTYLQIAESLGLSTNTVKSYCRRHDAMRRICRHCGKPLSDTAKRKPKTFCGDYCRSQWWQKNRDLMREKAVYHFECKHCHRHFESYGNKGRVYCSRACYISHRYGGVP